MRKIGRPPIEESMKQSHMCRFRLTENEFEHLQKAAIDERATMSDVIRKGLYTIGAIQNTRFE